ncbi:MAG: DNA-3-methyladenine glycosylase 2 family protein [Hyphomicrobiales bacterium]
MVITLLSESLLAEAAALLSVAEPRFAGVVARHGLPSLRHGVAGLEGLLHLVTEQFLSLRAADAIWQRLRARLSPFTPDTILACPADELYGLGLSRAKVKSFHGIAEAAPDFAGFQALPDEAVRQALLALPGVGPWTAENYLLSCLLRPDAWPVGDIALQNAARDLFGLPVRPTAPELARIGEQFAPWRAVAARLLWSHYRGMKALPQA